LRIEKWRPSCEDEIQGELFTMYLHRDVFRTASKIVEDNGNRAVLSRQNTCDVAFDVTLTSVSLAVGVAGALVTAWRGVAEYRLKSKAQRAATDVQLAQLFAQLVPVANARGTVVASEAAINALLEHSDVGRLLGDEAEQLNLRAVIQTIGTISLPVGEATQVAALASLGYLGAAYESLRQPATAALEALEYVDHTSTPQLARARRSALEQIRDR
jgi:hypothetical protein